MNICVSSMSAGFLKGSGRAAMRNRITGACIARLNSPGAPIKMLWPGRCGRGSCRCLTFGGERQVSQLSLALVICQFLISAAEFFFFLTAFSFLFFFRLLGQFFLALLVAVIRFSGHCRSPFDRELPGAKRAPRKSRGSLAFNTKPA